MLTTDNKVTITGKSVIGETVVCTFLASIDVENPRKMVVYQNQRNKEAYNENLEKCKEDFESFKQIAFAKQAELLNNKAE